MKKLLLIVGLFFLPVQAMEQTRLVLLYDHKEGEGMKEWQKEVGRYDLLERLKKALESKEKTSTIPVWLYSATCLGYTIEEQRLDTFLHDAIKRRNTLAVKHFLDGGANPLKVINGSGALTLARDCKRRAPAAYEAQSKCQTILFQVEEATKKARQTRSE